MAWVNIRQVECCRGISVGTCGVPCQGLPVLEWQDCDPVLSPSISTVETHRLEICIQSNRVQRLFGDVVEISVTGKTAIPYCVSKLRL